MPQKKIVVVGAGPAGMMAAIRAGQLGQDVTLVEKKSSPGNKLLLSGKGRCNLTNACDFDPFLERFSGNGQFLRDAFKKFFNSQLISFFEERGLRLKTERQLRVFPQTDRSDSILEVLKKELARNKVKVILKAALKDILVENKTVKKVLISGDTTLPVDRVILATGGISYSFTGSSGEGLEVARKLGHQIVPLRSGLVGLETRQRYPELLSGLTLKNIVLKFRDAKKAEITSEVGEMLFTDFGISGPLVISLSGRVIDWLAEGKQVHVAIDLKPGLTEQVLDQRLLREFKANAKKSLGNTLTELMPKSLAKVFTDMAGIDPGKKSSQVTQEERRLIVAMLKGLRFDISQARPIEEAMITRGGISLKEINPRTMESRIIKGLYFAGEMIDVDADTGGFNLQAAFSTGYLAGESAAKS